MSGINTLGTANTGDYQIGRGKVYFGTLDGTGRPTAYRDVGNAKEFSISVSTETLKHQSSRAGLKVTDKEVTLSQEVGVKLVLDEINFENLAAYLAGEEATLSNTAATGAIAPAVGGNLAITVKGRWYDLYKGVAGVPTTDTSGDRIYDIGVLTVTTLDGMTTYVATTDYIVDQPMGRIFIVSTGSMPVNTSFKVAMAANAGADTTVDEVRALTATSLEVAVKFIAENPANANQQYEFQFHKVALQADGDFSLIGDEFTTMSFKGTAQTDETADPDSPILTIRTHSHAQG